MNQDSARKVMFVRDPVLGNLKLSPLQEDLLKTVEVQRLSFIHQLGTTFQSYPGAHCMRLSHALGVSSLAGRMGRTIPGDRSEREIDLLEAAGMLHDIGHTPWSHTLEPLFMELTGDNHMDLVGELVRGESVMDIPGAGRIPDILADHQVDPVSVSDLIRSRFTGPRYLQQIIFGEVDADMLDYLQRDFHFTGVAYGHIEVERIISTMVRSGDELVFQHKALDAVRDFLLARLQMFSSVYLHKKTRIVDQMLLRAARRSIVDLGEIDRFWEQTDDELLSFLVCRSSDPWVREMAWRVKYRQKLFTQVFRIDAASRSSDEERFLERIRGLGESPSRIVRRLEEEIAGKACVPEGDILVDLPLEAVMVSEERFEKVDIRFLMPSGMLLSLPEIDPPFSRYMAEAKPNKNLLSVSCTPEHRDKVAVACEKVLEEAAIPLFSGFDLD